ncbi:Lysine-specific demethylase 8 [Fasciola gigantica]|uniref:JmjC domain-containing protein 5 n=1 Tax=Fasciola gigantica TaxID=46835 RepID=A0A504YN80_FASGI|nr:Lysine-specific demethylase 8 [Fasciola gigantica]
MLGHFAAKDIIPDEFERDSEYVLEYIWEKLHSGHWKNVHDCWRIAYALVRVLRGLYILTYESAFITSSHVSLKSALKEFDYSLLLGYPILDAVATRLASAAHELMEDIPSGPSNNKRPKHDSSADIPFVTLDAFDVGDRPICPLKRIDRPSLEKFLQLMTHGKPFILTGAIDFWPACLPSSDRRWSVESWRRRAGNRTVPIEIGSRYTDEMWGQELMTLNEFIDRYVDIAAQVEKEENQQLGYLAQHQLFLQIPELGEDVFTPDYCLVTGKPECNEATVDSNVWFGPIGTVSPLHHDSDRANLLAQVRGYKYVILYTADQTSALYPHTDQMLCNTSQVDAEHPDLVRFPDFTQAKGFHGVLGPREMLYIPPRCWHYIRALSTSFSVNFWWNVSQDFIPSWSMSN